MKLKFIIFVALTAAIPLTMDGKDPLQSDCQADSAVCGIMAKPKKQLKEVTFSVPMHCENCADKIQENISFEKGVKDLKVSFEKKTVWVLYDRSKTDESRLAEALRSLGYEVKILS